MMKKVKHFPTHARIVKGKWFEMGTDYANKWFKINEMNDFGELALCEDGDAKDEFDDSEDEGFAWVDKEDCIFGYKTDEEKFNKRTDHSETGKQKIRKEKRKKST